jgi:hypothetical protein
MISQFRTGENMMQLTEHFTDKELHVDGADPRIVVNGRLVCVLS